MDAGQARRGGLPLLPRAVAAGQGPRQGLLPRRHGASARTGRRGHALPLRLRQHRRLQDIHRPWPPPAGGYAAARRRLPQLRGAVAGRDSANRWRGRGRRPCRQRRGRGRRPCRRRGGRGCERRAPPPHRPPAALRRPRRPARQVAAHGAHHAGAAARQHLAARHRHVHPFRAALQRRRPCGGGRGAVRDEGGVSSEPRKRPTGRVLCRTQRRPWPLDAHAYVHLAAAVGAALSCAGWARRIESARGVGGFFSR